MEDIFPQQNNLTGLSIDLVITGRTASDTNKCHWLQEYAAGALAIVYSSMIRNVTDKRQQDQLMRVLKNWKLSVGYQCVIEFDAKVTATSPKSKGIMRLYYGVWQPD